jgi:hypothetical protein
MKYTDITNSNTLPNKMEINLDMLGALMLDGVGGHVDRADVVTIDQSGFAKWRMKLKEKLT